MTRNRWQRTEKLYHKALEREPAEWSAFLEKACEGDEELRREVESLLAYGNEAGDFMEAPAIEVEARAVASDPGNSLVGRQFGSYKVLSLLGTGGMGEVYLAEDTSLDRKVALKFLPEFMQQDPTAKKRFLREAKSVAALDHPFICKIYQTGDEDDRSFIAMEYVQGQTLKEKLAKGPLPLKEALETAVQMAAAVEKAHGKGIVHRDLKPSNIMLTPEGHVKVMDFGLAKRLVPAEGGGSQEQTVTGNLTKTGTTLGTLAYMSPEQLRGQEVDTRSDIFSFGVVFYEMLTGVHPFKKAQSVETSTAILSETPLPLSRHMSEVPPVLQHSVRKMLAKEPGRRYQIVDDVRIDLADLREEVGDSRVLTEEAVSGPSQVRPPVVERSWRETMLLGLTVLMAIVAAVALWGPWWASPPTQQPLTRLTIPTQPLAILDWHTTFTFSADGTRVVYPSERDGRRQLYLREIDQLEATPIVGTENATYSFFSPDSQWLGFFADGKMKKVSLSGGSPVSICDAAP